MHIGKFVFAQITQFLPQRQFRRILAKYDDRTKGWSMSHWNHLLVLMFGQLTSCDTLRELTDITIAHGKKSKHLGFGHKPINRQLLSKASLLRDHRIFEEFAFYMVAIAQSKRITKEFELHGRFYAVDSTIIDLCMSVFKWAEFRTTKSGIRIHTQIDIATEIPVFYRITNAKVHDVNSMDWLTYEPLACYVFDRGYFDLARLFSIEQSGAFFIIREKFRPDYSIEAGEDWLEGEDNVLRDQTVRLTGKRNKENYPVAIRRIVYYAPDLQRTFITTRTTFILQQRILHSCISTDGKSKYFSSGLSSISESNNFGENLRTQSEYRYTLQSSHTVSLQSLNTNSKLADQSLKLCVSLASPCLPLTAFKNSFSRLSRRRENQVMDNSVLSLKMVNIF